MRQKENIFEELNRMKYLIKSKPGTVISEQDWGAVATSAAGGAAAGAAFFGIGAYATSFFYIEYGISQDGYRSIILDMAQTKKWAPPKDWREVFNATLEKQLEMSRTKGGVLFNGDLVKLVDYHPIRDQRTCA